MGVFLIEQRNPTLNSSSSGLPSTKVARPFISRCASFNANTSIGTRLRSFEEIATMRFPVLQVLTFTIIFTLEETASFTPASRNYFRGAKRSQSSTDGTSNESGWLPIARKSPSSPPSSTSLLLSSKADQDGGGGSWQGDVVPQGTIRGCSITPVGETEPHTEWAIAIDGVEADLGRFSQALYKQITSDAKKQRFQGFRPGTIPPHLEPTYRAYSMDECARETVMEAMQQNNIRPFSDARMNFKIEKVNIPPAPVKKTGKNSSKKRSSTRKTKEGSIPPTNEDGSAAAVLGDEYSEEPPVVEPQWQEFETMDEAIKAGWKPGQSFSFVATNVKGQNVLGNRNAEGARPLGLNY